MAAQEEVMAEQGVDLLHALSANFKDSNQAGVIDGRLRDRLQDPANRRNEWSEFSYELTTARAGCSSYASPTCS